MRSTANVEIKVPSAENPFTSVPHHLKLGAKPDTQTENPGLPMVLSFE